MNRHKPRGTDHGVLGRVTARLVVERSDILIAPISLSRTFAISFAHESPTVSPFLTTSDTTAAMESRAAATETP